jgi:hypothetical protein
LPALFREAVREANTRQGRLGADALLSDWRSLQQELKAHAPGSDRAEIQSKLAAIHNEELSIVVSALGNRAVVRTLSDTRVNLAETQAQIANEAARGIDAGQASVVITQVKEKLNSAERALNAGDNIAALDYGTQAAALLSGLDFYLIETRRIPGLESLYPKAVEKLSGEPNVSARGLMNDLSQINADARNALRAGDRWVAQAKLKQARDYQIQLVLRVLGGSSSNRSGRHRNETRNAAARLADCNQSSGCGHTAFRAYAQRSSRSRLARTRCGRQRRSRHISRSWKPRCRHAERATASRP